MADFSDLSRAVNDGDFAGAEAAARALLAAGVSAEEIVKAGIVPALNTVGELFSAGEVFIPEMLVSAKAAQKAIDLLKPLLARAGAKPIGRVVIGTVAGDLHDLGKNIVAMMFEGGGFAVKDLGVDVSPEAFVAAVREFKPQVVALSSLLTTTMKSVPHTIEALTEAGLRDKVTVIVGGPPTSDEFRKKVGADHYGKDAPTAVALARKIIGAA